MYIRMFGQSAVQVKSAMGFVPDTSVCGRQDSRILAPPFQVLADATGVGLMGNV
jgi:hypothetical protein